MEMVPLAGSTEVIKQGSEAIKEFKRALNDGTKKLPWVKLMLVGQGRAGKTS